MLIYLPFMFLIKSRHEITLYENKFLDDLSHLAYFLYYSMLLSTIVHLMGLIIYFFDHR